MVRGGEASKGRERPAGATRRSPRQVQYDQFRADGATPWAAAQAAGIRSERSLGKYERAYQGQTLTEGERDTEAAEGRLHAAQRRGRHRRSSDPLRNAVPGARKMPPEPKP